MNRFTVRGVVEAYIRQQRNIVVENVAELRQWWEEQHIDTILDWDRARVLITLSTREFVLACEIGDVVDYTIEWRDQADGRRIRGVELAVVAPAAP
jgi:hypothetical protein